MLYTSLIPLLANGTWRTNPFPRVQSEFTKDGRHCRGVAENACADLNIPVRKVNREQLNRLSNNRPHQGLVLVASDLPVQEIRSLESTPKAGSLWLALDEVVDPQVCPVVAHPRELHLVFHQNLGAIVRSAHYFGTIGVVVCLRNW